MKEGVIAEVTDNGRRVIVDFSGHLVEFNLTLARARLEQPRVDHEVIQSDQGHLVFLHRQRHPSGTH